MKNLFEEKGVDIIAEIDRPICIGKIDGHYFILTTSKLGELVACNVSTIEKEKKQNEGIASAMRRFADLQDDLKQLDLKRSDANPS